MSEGTVFANMPKYAGVPVTRPQGMWLAYLDMMGIKWAVDAPEKPQETLLIELKGKTYEKTGALIVANDFVLRKYQKELASRMQAETMKAVLILGQAPEAMRAGIRKMSYIRRGRNGLFHESAYFNIKGELQNLNNTTFKNGFTAIPNEATTTYQTYSTDNFELIEKHNKAASTAWGWNFDVDGRCVKVAEPKLADDEPVFIQKQGTGERPNDPIFMTAKPKDCRVSTTKGSVVAISFTEEACRKISDTGYIRISAATEQNPIIYFMEGSKDDFKLSKRSLKGVQTRPYRAQPTAAAMAQLIDQKGWKGYYDLTQVTTKSGTKYWCVKLEGHNA